MKNYTEVTIAPSNTRSMRLGLGVSSDIAEIDGSYRYRFEPGTIFSLECTEKLESTEKGEEESSDDYYVLQAPQSYVQIDEHSDIKDSCDVLLHISGADAVRNIRERLEKMPLENTLVPEMYPILGLLVSSQIDRSDNNISMACD